MALRRFYIENENFEAESIRLTGDLFHHIRDVCRFGVGDEFELLPGDGRAWRVRITQMDNKTLTAEKLEERKIAALKKPHIVLALSVPKLPKVDWIVEKCVELGVAEIRPFVSDYSFLRKISELSTNRIARWQKLVQAATQQSGRGELLKIGAPTTLNHLLKEFRLTSTNPTPAIAGLFPYEGETRLGLKDALTQALSRPLDQLWVFVGSEGGFSLAEVQMFADVGLNPVSLGDQILRVETACLALVSVIQYEIGTLR